MNVFQQLGFQNTIVYCTTTQIKPPTIIRGVLISIPMGPCNNLWENSSNPKVIPIPGEVVTPYSLNRWNVTFGDEFPQNTYTSSSTKLTILTSIITKFLRLTSQNI